MSILKVKSFLNDNNLDFYLPLKGNIIDYSKNNRIFTNYGATLTTGPFGETDSAYYFNGNTSTYISTDYTGLEGSGPMSISFWFKTTETATGTNNTVISWGTSIGNYGYFLISIENGQLYCRFSSTNCFSNTLLNDGEWHHAVVIKPNNATAAEVIYYIDNEFVPQVPYDSINVINIVPLYNLEIGRHTNINASNFTGSLSKISVFSKELSIDEINSLFNNTNLGNKFFLNNIFVNNTKYFNEIRQRSGTNNVNSYSIGPAHGEIQPSFIGGVVENNGKVILAPRSSINIGIYDPDTNTYVSGPAHGETAPAFVGAVLTNKNKVILLPHTSEHIGIYDPDTNTYVSGPAHNLGTTAFVAGILTHNNKVILVPRDAPVIGIYDPVLNTYTDGPLHYRTNAPYTGAVLTPKNKVILVPRNGPVVGIYDPISNTYTEGAAHNEGSSAFVGGVLAPNGKIIFIPHYSDYFGIYDPDTDTYTRGTAHNKGNTAFAGAVLSPTGKVICTPFSSSTIGIYDPILDTYTNGPTLTGYFDGSVLAPNGNIIFCPYSNNNIGIYDPDDKIIDIKYLMSPNQNKF